MIIFWLIIGLMTIVATGILVVPYLRVTSNNAIKPAYALLWLFLVPLLSISLYLKLGSNQSVMQQQQAAMVNTEIAKLGSLPNIILALEQKVALVPDSRGLSLLGRLYLKSQRFKEASEAFAKANQLTPNQPEILIGYAQSLYFLHHQKLTAAKRLLQQALQQQPNQPDALNLLAIDAYQQGNYSAAVKYWEQVSSQLPQGSKEQQDLLQSIAMAQKKIKERNVNSP